MTEDFKEINFTLFEAGSEVRKKYSYTDRLVKQSEATISDYKATRKTFSPSEFASLIDSLDPNQAIGLGLANQDGMTSPKGLGGFSRSQKHFNFKSKISGAILLDVDDSDLAPDEFLSLLEKIHPDLRTCAKVVKYSSSAGLYRNNEQLTPINKYHIYLFIEDLGDAKRLGKTIYTKLWCGGFGHIKVSKDGKLLERCIIDQFVWSPERLIFEAEPNLNDGIEKRVPPIRYIDGHLLKSRRITYTKSEESKRNELIESAKAKLKPKAERAKGQYTKTEAKKLVQKGFTEEQAKATIQARMRGELSVNDIVLTDDGRTASIEQLMKERKHCYIADPISPERGTQKAEFNPATNRYPANVYSHIHGGTTYQIKDPEIPKTDWSKALTPEKAQEAVKDALNDHTPKKAIKASAGLGKTQLVIGSLKKGEKVEFYIPTHKLGSDLIGRFDGLTAQIIKGRNQKDDDGQPMCLRAKEAKLLAESGYPVYSNLCEKDGDKCKWFAGCRHINQFKKDADVRIYTHAYLALNRGQNEWKIDQIDQAIIDESFHNTLTFKSHITLDDVIISNASDEVRGDLVKTLLSGNITLHDKEILKGHLTEPFAALIQPSMSLEEIREATAKRNIKLNLKVNKLIKDLLTPPEERSVYIDIRTKSETEKVFCSLGHKKLRTLPEKITYIDASLDETITKTLLGEDTKIFDVIARRNNVHITQCTSRTFSKAQICADLENKENITETQAQGCLQLRKQVFDYIERLSKQHSHILLITYKSLRQHWEDELPDNVSIEHFGNLRGIDAYKDSNAIVVLGRNMPSPNAVDDVIRSLWPTEEPTDDLKAIVMNQILGEEGLQGVDRGRLIWNEQPKHVFLLTKESLDIEVHDTKSWNDMRKTELNNLEDSIESLGFIPLTVTSLVNTGLCLNKGQAEGVRSAILDTLGVRFLTTNSVIKIYILENRRLKNDQANINIPQLSHPSLRLVSLRKSSRGRPTPTLTWLTDSELKFRASKLGFWIDKSDSDSTLTDKEVLAVSTMSAQAKEGKLAWLAPKFEATRKQVKINTQATFEGVRPEPFIHYADTSEPSRDITIKYDPACPHALEALLGYGSCNGRIEAEIETETRISFLSRRASNDSVFLDEWLASLMEDRGIKKVSGIVGAKDWPESITFIPTERESHAQY